LFRPRQDKECAVTDNGQALQTHRAVARSVFHRLLCHAIFTRLRVALAMVETCYLLGPERGTSHGPLTQAAMAETNVQ
jgi:hypothetical protein